MSVGVCLCLGRHFLISQVHTQECACHGERRVVLRVCEVGGRGGSVCLFVCVCVCVCVCVHPEFFHLEGLPGGGGSSHSRGSLQCVFSYCADRTEPFALS